MKGCIFHFVKVADTPLHIQGDDVFNGKFWVINNFFIKNDNPQLFRHQKSLVAMSTKNLTTLVDVVSIRRSMRTTRYCILTPHCRPSSLGILTLSGRRLTLDVRI